MASTNEAVRWGGMGFNFREAQITGHDVASGNFHVAGNNNVVNYHGSQESADKVKNVLSWLKPHAVDYLPAHEEAHSRQTPGTGGWFFNTRTYTIWRGLDSTEPALHNLQCVGIPGAGKTTLASSVIENLRLVKPILNSDFGYPGQSDSSIVLYAYFRHDTQSHQKIPNVLASLLQQVVRIKRNVSDELYDLYEACSMSGIIPSPDRIVNILRLELSVFRKVFIVVDALDEYSTETYSLTHDLVTQLERLDARLLITSRHRVDFMPGTFSSLDISAKAEDIRIMVLDHVKGNLAKIVNRTPGLLEEIVKTVVGKAEGMFIIAKLLIESIPDLHTSADVRTTLKMLPTGLHDTYLMTMKRIWQQKPHVVELAMKVLAWVFHAKRLLRVLELQHAVSFRLEERIIPVDDMIAEDTILSSCLGLVVFVKNAYGDLECQFAHFTTKEFLDTCWQDYFPDGEKQITETCLAYLGPAVSAIPPELTERIICIEKPRERDDDDEWNQYRTSIFALCEYAATFWGVHVKAMDGILSPDAYASFFSHPISPYVPNQDLDGGTCIYPTVSMPPARYRTLYLARFGLLEYLQMHAAAIQKSKDNATEVPLNYNDIQDNEGWTALHFSALFGHLNVVGFLLDSGANVNQPDRHGNNPLHVAINEDNLATAVVQLLLDRGALVDEPGFRNRAPIFRAIDLYSFFNQFSSEIIRLLLQHEVDIYRGDDRYGKNETPLSLAQKSENPEIKQLLEEYARTHPPKRRAYKQIFPGGHHSAADSISEDDPGSDSESSTPESAPSFSPEKDLSRTVSEPPAYEPSGSLRTGSSGFCGGRQALTHSSSSSSSPSMTRDTQQQPSAISRAELFGPVLPPLRNLTQIQPSSFMQGPASVDWLTSDSSSAPRGLTWPTQSSSPSIITQWAAPDLSSSLPNCLSSSVVRGHDDGSNSISLATARGDRSAEFTLPGIEELYGSLSDSAEAAQSSRTLALAMPIPALQSTGSTTTQQIPTQSSKRAARTPSPVTFHGKRMKFS